MNSTSAALVIIHALWPGAATPTDGVVRPSGMVGLPSLSLGPTFSDALGSPLLRYASSPATRCSSVGAGGGGLAAAGAAAWAKRDALADRTRHAARSERRGLSLSV